MIETTADALVLGSVDFGEADRVVSLLTPELGKLSAFAAGARKSRRRFGGALEPFTRLRVQLAPRRGELFFLAGCSIEDAHAPIRGELARIGHAGHATELTSLFCKEREPQREFFAALASYLAGIAAGTPAPEDLLAFELRALELAGLSPRFLDCAVCGGAPSETPLFDPAHGGVLCPSCEPQAFPGAGRAGKAPLVAARELQMRGPFSGMRIEDPRVRGQARRMIRDFTRHTLGKAPRSVAFFEQVGEEG